jgi:hypothetical protein
MTTPELIVLYGIPTMFLFVGLIAYTLVRFDSWRYDRLVARNASKSNEAKSGSA